MSRTYDLAPAHHPPWRRVLISVILLAGFIALLNLSGGLTRVRSIVPGLSQSSITYQTTTVSRGNVAATVTATGPISAATSVPLSFKESGKLTSIKVSVGEQVTQGQVLTTLDTTDLQVALDQAKATLAQQQANLAKVQAGSTSTAVAAAQTTVDNAKQTVADAQAAVATAQDTNAQNLKAAQASVATAQTNLSNAQAALAAVQDEAPKAIAADQLAITDAQKNLATAQDQEAKGLAADQLAIANDQKSLAAEQATLAADLPVLEQQIEQAKDTLWSDQISRDATCGRGGGASCDAANAQVAAAQTAVNTAQSGLSYSQTQGQQQVQSAQATIQTAQAQYAKDQTSLRAAAVSAQNAIDTANAQLAKDQSSQQASITSAQNQVKQNQAALTTAETGLGQAQAQGNASAQSAQTSVNNAIGSERSAEASYDETTAPASASDLKTAQANLDSANLTAPFGGTISAVNGAVGQWISGGTVAATSGSSASSTAIFTLMDLNDLQVVAQVNEADVSKVKVGDPVTFNVSAFANQTFNGKVLTIQPVGTTSSNVVVYNVTSSIQSTNSAALYPGMTATVTIVSSEDDNVLTVPSSALTFAQTLLKEGLATRPSGGNGSATSATTSSQNYVATLTGGKLTLVPVTAGLSDGTVTAVSGALTSGETVVTGQSGGTSSRSASSSGASSSSSSSRASSPLTSGGPGGP